MSKSVSISTTAYDVLSGAEFAQSPKGLKAPVPAWVAHAIGYGRMTIAELGGQAPRGYDARSPLQAYVDGRGQGWVFIPSNATLAARGHRRDVFETIIRPEIVAHANKPKAPAKARANTRTQMPAKAARAYAYSARRDGALVF